MLKSLYFITIFVFSSFVNINGQTVGLFLNDPASQNGYTLFAPSVSKTSYLVNNCGELINSWESEFTPNFSSYLLEDGSLLRPAKIQPPTLDQFGKGGIQKFAWNGNLTWEYSFVGSEYAQHHDIEPLPNGNILVIVYEMISFNEVIQNGRDPLATTGDLWVERILELEPQGSNEANIVWEWSAWDHIVQDFDATKLSYGVVAEHPEKINVNYGSVSDGDWLHFNAIDYNPQLDQIVVSSRTFNEIYVIDHSTSTEEATSNTGGNSGKGGDLLYRWGNPDAYDRGDFNDQAFSGQHHAHWIEEGLLDEGKLMVFNNGIQRPEGVFSTIDVIDPPIDAAGNYIISEEEPYGPTSLFWTYESTDGENFYSSKLSGAQRLPNGNTLICDGNSSRLFEVTYDGEIVWDYQSPINILGPIAQGEILTGTSIFRALKYDVDYPAFDNVDLTPGAVLEIDPWENDCQIYETGSVDVDDVETEDQFKITPNPIGDEFLISNPIGQPLQISVFTISSQKIFTTQFVDDQFLINSNNWPAGCYFVQIVDMENNLLQVSKLVK